MLIAFAGRHFGCEPADCRLQDDGIICANQKMTLAELHAAGAKVGDRFIVRRKAYLSPRTIGFNVHGVRLAVHRVTGEIMTLQSVHAADIGRLINPMQCRGQLDGAIAMGFGWALYEKMVYDAQGVMLNPALRDYRIPAFADVPRSEIYFADTYDKIGPLGAKAQGECAINCVAPAIVNAVANATGVRFTSLPLSPERIFDRLGIMTAPETAKGGYHRHADAGLARQGRRVRQMAAAHGRGGGEAIRLRQGNGHAALPADASRLGHPATLRLAAMRRPRGSGLPSASAWSRKRSRFWSDRTMSISSPMQRKARCRRPVSAVISTRIKPGQEDAYREWGRRIAAAQAKSPGFQGYRVEPPVPGVQEDWLTILRFDSEANLQTWLNSPERKKLIDESEAFTDACRVRTVRTGFDQWFEVPGAPPPPAWKQNMVVLLVLYPLVFLLNEWLQKPILVGIFGLPYWAFLFINNAVSVVMLSLILPL